MRLVEWAIEDALKKVKKNIHKFNDQFPHVSVDGNGGRTYTLNPNTEWTSGFWSGLLWLCYAYSKDETYSQAAQQTVESFHNRLAHKIEIDHHDIGFLYSLSSKAQWILKGDESAKALTIKAADHLLTRWREEGQYIQAWGPIGEPDDNGGRIIIDCLLNLPLLYWATKQTGDEKYKQIAISQADKSRRYLVRGDDSSYHTFIFNQVDGEPIGGTTHQGFTNGSTWTRGQAWGIYGFALSYRYTGDKQYLETAKRMAKYFFERLPEDNVVYWDFNVPVNEHTYRDSSASAIAAAGLLELMEHLDESDPDRGYYAECINQTMVSLIEGYSTMDDREAEGLIRRGSYHVRGDSSPDDYMIWGDYFYLEALMRLEKGIKGFWYE